MTCTYYFRWHHIYVKSPIMSGSHILDRQNPIIYLFSKVRLVSDSARSDISKDPIFCLLITHASTSSNPASCIAASKGGNYQLPSRNCRGFLPVIHMDSLCWNPPIARPIRGVIVHVSNPIRSTVCTTDLKNISDTLGFAPSLRKIIKNRDQLFLKSCRFPTNSGQSSSEAVMIWPRYFNEVTEFSDVT